MSGESDFNPPLFVHSSIDDAGLSPGAFRVLGHLVRRADKKGVAYPGIRRIAETCRMNCHTVIKAIQELEKRGFVVVGKTPGRCNQYRLHLGLKLGRGEPSKPAPAETKSVAYLGNSDQSGGVAHLGNGVLPTQATGCCLTKSADQVPEPLEIPEGTPLRYSNKVVYSGADAPTHSLRDGREEEVTEKEGVPGRQLVNIAEPQRNSPCSVLKSEPKNPPQQERARFRRRPHASRKRPESEAEVINYVTSIGFPKEDGKWIWAHWVGNGFTNRAKPIQDWRATIQSWALMGYLPSQKKMATGAKNGIRGNLI